MPDAFSTPILPLLLLLSLDFKKALLVVSVTQVVGEKQKLAQKGLCGSGGELITSRSHDLQAVMHTLPGFVTPHCASLHPFDMLRAGFIRPIAHSVALLVQGTSGSRWKVQ